MLFRLTPLAGLLTELLLLPTMEQRKEIEENYFFGILVEVESALVNRPKILEQEHIPTR